MAETMHHDVIIRAGKAELNGRLSVPPKPPGIVVFAHGSGSSRLSPRNQQVASVLQEAGFGTLLFDLLTEREGVTDARSADYRFDIPLLGQRLVTATDWLRQQEAVRRLDIGYFGASTGAAAALTAAAERPEAVAAVVSRGGRPDLAAEALERVTAPTLLIVGDLDAPVIGMNQAARDRLGGVTELVLVQGATHLFEEPGAMGQVTRLAERWFRRHLGS
ncbi:MAG TPA: alpha/beta family hydrolase [Thermomicrobiales bacterium]|nr:alpha/beta family hydrolase [Thermomicrobiales bacterium]